MIAPPIDGVVEVIQQLLQNDKNTHSFRKYEKNGLFYFAYSTERVSRITVILICPG